MKIVDATIEDGKMCGQLLNFLKIAKAPEMAVNDLMALNNTMKWFNEFVKALAMDLQSKSKPALPKVDFVPPPVKKKKGKK